MIKIILQLYFFIIIVTPIYCAEKVTIEYKNKKTLFEIESLEIKISFSGKEVSSRATSIDSLQSYFREIKKIRDNAVSCDEVLKFQKPIGKKDYLVANFLKFRDYLSSKSIVIRKKISFDDIEVLVVELKSLDNVSKEYTYFFKKVNNEYFIIPDLVLFNDLANDLDSKDCDVNALKESYRLKENLDKEKAEKQKLQDLENAKTEESLIKKKIEPQNLAENLNKSKLATEEFSTIWVMSYSGELNDPILNDIREIDQILFIRQINRKKGLCVGIATTREEQNKKLKPQLIKIQALNEKYKNAGIITWDNTLPNTGSLIELLFNDFYSIDYLFEPAFYYIKTQEEKTLLQNMRESFYLIKDKKLPQKMPSINSAFNQYVLLINANDKSKDNIKLAKKLMYELKQENKLIEIHFNCWLLKNDENEDAMEELISKVSWLNDCKYKYSSKSEMVEYILKIIAKGNSPKLKDVLISCLNIITYEKVNTNNRKVYHNEAWEKSIKLIKRFAIEKNIDLKANFKEFNAIKAEFEMGTTDPAVNEVDWSLDAIEEGKEKNIKETLIKAIELIKDSKECGTEEYPFKLKLWEKLIKRAKKIAMDNKIDLSDSFKTLEETKTILEPKTIYDE